MPTRSSLLLLILQAVFWSCCAPGPAAALGGKLRADGTEFVLSLDDGRVLRGKDLVGLRLVLATRDGKKQVRIDSVDKDWVAMDKPILLYRLSVMGPGHEPGDFCQEDPYGRRAGFPMPDGAGGFRFTCTSGAEAKCILLGYRPWEDRDGVPMRDLFRACTHMIRADYGGDDRPTTKNGTLIDVYDRFGIENPTPPMKEGLAFEAAWGPDGAVCVAHPRIPDHVSLQDLASRYPRLVGHLGPEACSEDIARRDARAILFNSSAVTLP